MTPIQWMLGAVSINVLIMLFIGLSEEETSAHFCRVLFMFFLMSVFFFAVAYRMGV